MLNYKKIIVAVVLSSATTIANAAIFDASIVIPNESVLLNFNGSGLDWVYAGPVAPNEFGAGQIELPSFRAGEGWRFASAGEWAIRPDWTNFIQPGFTTADVSVVAGWNNHTKYKFASEYWSTFRHVDLNDAADGNLTNGFDIGSLTGVYETWYVRGAVAAVPEPETYAMMLAGLGLIGFSARRRKIS